MRVKIKVDNLKRNLNDQKWCPEKHYHLSFFR